MRVKTVLILIGILYLSFINAQSLSDRTLMKLATDIKRQYAITMMEGATMHKTSDGHVLVSVVSVKKSPTMQRVAQVKAARVAGEYLEGARNKSVTVYETIDRQSYSLNDNAEEQSHTSNSMSSSTINQDVSDSTQRVSEDNFSDKIIQSSLTRIRKMEPLTRFAGEDGTQIFVFYLVMK